MERSLSFENNKYVIVDAIEAQSGAKSRGGASLAWRAVFLTMAVP